MEQDWKNELKLLRAGSGTDRLARRSAIAGELERWLPALVGTFRGGSHEDQRQAVLALMEGRRPEIVPVLGRVLADGRKADETGLALLLGKQGDQEAVPALLAALKARRPLARRAALFGLARLRAPAGLEVARALLASQPNDREHEIGLFVLGVLGGEQDMRALLDGLSDRGQDGVRAAAALGTAMMEGETPHLALIAALGDENATVSRGAAAGLARRGQDPRSFEGLRRIVVSGTTSRGDLPVWITALAAAGGDASIETLDGLRKGPGSKAMARALAGAAVSFSPQAAREWLVPYLADPEPQVRETAILGFAAAELRAPTGMTFWIHVEDPDREVRRTAISVEFALKPESAGTRIDALLASSKADLRALGAELRLTASDPAYLAWLCRVRLQVRADDLAISPSWLVFTEIGAFVLRLLELEDALPKGGAGAAPGVSAAARAAAAALHRVPREEEDLRRHLDRHPYFDGPRVPEFAPGPGS